MQDKIIAAIAAYLEQETIQVDDEFGVPKIAFGGLLNPAGIDHAGFCCEIAAEIATAIAPLVEAGEPDWKDAPEWADHLAQDFHGQWHWFRGEPKPDGQYWLASKYYNQRAFTPNPNWKDTLRKRPK